MHSRTSWACASAVRQVVAIVGGHQGNSGFARQTDDFRIDALFNVQALILNLQEEIPFSENVAQPISGFARLLGTFLDQIFGDRSAQTGGQRDQSFAVLGQQVVIDSRLVIKAFEKSRGDQLDQIAIAFGIFAEQDQVIGAALARFGGGPERAVGARAATISPRSCRLPLATYTSQPMMGFTPRVLALW